MKEELKYEKMPTRPQIKLIIPICKKTKFDGVVVQGTYKQLLRKKTLDILD